MTTLVNGYTTQKSKKTRYDTGQPCGCFKCSWATEKLTCGQTDLKDDWNYGHETCCLPFCPDKALCAKPNPEECDIGVDSHDRNSLIKATWNDKGPNLKCVFDVDRINTLEQIKNFKEKFGESEDYNSVVGNYCQESSNTCIIDPQTGIKMDKCSRLKSTGKDGELCRSWFGKQSENVKDTLVQNYCGLYNTPDCKCVNRSQNSVYQDLKIGKNINDGCWFLPCSNPQTYLTTQDVRNPKCPENFCNIVYNVMSNNNVTIDKVKDTINCAFKAAPPPAPKPQPPPPAPKPQPQPVTPNITPTPITPNITPTPTPQPTPQPTPNPTVAPSGQKKIYLEIVFLTILLVVGLFILKRW